MEGEGKKKVNSTPQSEALELACPFVAIGMQKREKEPRLRTEGTAIYCKDLTSDIVY